MGFRRSALRRGIRNVEPNCRALAAQHRDETRDDARYRAKRFGPPFDGRTPRRKTFPEPAVVNEDEWQEETDQGEYRPQKRREDDDRAHACKPFPVGIVLKAG